MNNRSFNVNLLTNLIKNDKNNFCFKKHTMNLVLFV